MPLWKHTGTKTHTASLRAKPTPLNIDIGSDRFAMFNKKRDIPDGQGLCLFAKRLERGRFLWPSPADGVVTITPAQLGYLLEGIDWRMPQHTWRPLAAG